MTLQDIIIHFEKNFIFIICIIIFNLIVIKSIRGLSGYINLFDRPDNIRKNHKKDTLLLGGVIIAFNISLFTLLHIFSFLLYGSEATIISSNRDLFSFYITAIIIFFIGLYDDKYQLAPIKKFFMVLFFIIVALLVDQSLVVNELRVDFLNKTIQLNNLSILFTALCIMLFLNALNMFDGINLQVGSYSLILLIYFLINNIAPLFSLVMIISILAFLYLNLKDISFLGDNGSLLLGYIFSYMFIKYYNIGSIKDIETIFILMFIPGIDMLRLFIMRIYSGKNPFYPDTNHLHHICSKLFKEKAFIIIQLLIIIPILSYIFLFKHISTIIISILIYFYFISPQKKI